MDFCKLIIALIFSIIFPSVLGHWTPAYSDSKYSSLYMNNWMASLNDKTPIFKLSLPGTHDTMALYGDPSGISGAEVITQTKSLPTQLESGIRVFDIRCRHYNDHFVIHHGIVFEHSNFDDVLMDMASFLSDNPTEALLVRVKEAYEPFNNTESFVQTFERYKEIFDAYIWHPTTQFPSLENVRGKIVILDDFSLSTKYGLNYTSSDFNIQDNYQLNTNWNLYSKWEDVKYQLDSANSRIKNNYFINYLSGSGGAFPFFVASGHILMASDSPRLSTGLTTPGWKHFWLDFPRVDCFIGICTIAFEGTNVLTYNYLEEVKPSYVGIIMMDFPGDGIIKEIIQINFDAATLSVKDGSLLIAFIFVVMFLYVCLKFARVVIDTIQEQRYAEYIIYSHADHSAESEALIV